MKKPLYTKSILSERELVDGTRISVMSCHTYEDGLTPDNRIVEGISFDEWMKELAPPAKLVGSYYRKEITWEEYEDSYVNFLRSNKKSPVLSGFAKRCTQETITILCIEETAEKCHRRILAAELQRIEPILRVEHR